MIVNNLIINYLNERNNNNNNNRNNLFFPSK